MNDLLKQQLFGTLGIESAEVTEMNEVTDVTEDDLPEDEIEAETSVAEAVEDVETDTEIDDIEDQGDDLEDAAEGLDELDVAVEGRIALGKHLTPIEAAALNLTVRQTVSKFVKDTGNLIPAHEGFQDDAEKNTKLAHEGLKEASKSFGEGAMAAAKKAWEFLKNVISDIINRFSGIEARANKVIAAAKAHQGTISGEVEFKKDNISVNGSATGQDIRDGLERMRGALDKLKDIDSSEAAIKAITELNAKEGEISFREIFAAHDQFMTEAFKSVFGEVAEKDGKLVAKPFPGEWTPAYVKPADAGSFGYDELVRVKPEEKGGKINVPAASKEEIIALAGTVKLVQNAVKGYKGFAERKAQAFKRAEAIKVAFGKNIQSAEDGRKDLDKGAIKATAEFFTFIRREMTFYAKLISATNQTTGAVLELCEKSLRSTGSTEGKTEEQTSEKAAPPATTE